MHALQIGNDFRFLNRGETPTYQFSDSRDDRGFPIWENIDDLPSSVAINVLKNMVNALIERM